jgi:hypothetical protein
VTVFHATFGAPPVGTKRFAEHFGNKMKHHESWAVFHERDIVAKCFAKANTIPGLRRLGWWRDWSHAGDEKVIRKLEQGASVASSPKSGFPLRGFLKALFTRDGVKTCFVVAGAGVFLGLSCLTTPLSVIATPVCWKVDREYYTKQKNPSATWKEDAGYDHDGDVQGLSDDSTLTMLSLDYHSLEKYIKLLREGDPF